MSDYRLSAAQIDDYRQNGFIGPLRLCPPDEMRDIREQVLEVMKTPGRYPTSGAPSANGRLAGMLGGDRGEDPRPYMECRHLDSRLIYDLCTHPAILDAARSIYGPDLILWRSTLIEKAVQGPEFRPHQDWGGVYSIGTEYGLEPPIHCNIWLALTEATLENGCVEFVPGVRAVLPTVPASSSPGATPIADPNAIDISGAVSMELRPGEFVLFSDRALHYSRRNESDRPRLGLAVRFTLSIVKVRSHFPGHQVMLVSGRDHTQANSLADPPIAAD